MLLRLRKAHLGHRVREFRRGLRSPNVTSEIKGLSSVLRVAAMAVAALMLPGVAFAHAVPPVLVGLALTPVVALVLAGIYSILRGRWRVVAINLLLITLWVGLFVLAANTVTSDYIIWSPIAAVIIHIIVLLVLIVWHFVRRQARAE